MGDNQLTSASASVSILRIGIIGAANIARKNIKAIQHPANINNCKLIAIASRSESKAIQFCNDHVQHADNVKLYTGTNAYQDLIDSNDIDALYIPLPTTLHLQYVKKALNAGKHVLIEKPVALSKHEYKEMIDIASSSTSLTKYLMDGTMFVHNPRTIDVVLHCSNQEEDKEKGTGIGEVQRIQSDFSFMGDKEFFTNNIRISSKGDTLGCIGDLGWYCIRMAQLVFKTCATFAQVTDYELNDDGVPIDATCLVMFDDKSYHQGLGQQGQNGQNGQGKKRCKILSFHCSFINPLTQSITMYGSKKSITMDDFVIPREEEKGNNDKVLTYQIQSQGLSHADLYSIHTNEIKKSLNCEFGVEDKAGNCPQEVLMWSNFVKFCRAYDADISDTEKVKKEAKELSKISYENQCIVDALMESIHQDGSKVAVNSALG
jgi:predicted dehydrogenase